MHSAALFSLSIYFLRPGFILASNMMRYDIIGWLQLLTKYQSPEITFRTLLQPFVGTVFSHRPHVSNRDLVLEASGFLMVFNLMELQQGDNK